jgi:murein DD-endopeptidase MepM/ murein hydrolase activator NlpD
LIIWPKFNCRKIIEKKYTILLVPNDTQRTRHLVINKAVLILSMTLAAVIITSLLVIYGLYSNVKSDNSVLVENNKQKQNSLEVLNQDIKGKQQQIDTLKQATEASKSKLVELLELESRINSILNNKTINLPISRGGGIGSADSIADSDELIKKLNEALTNLQAYEVEQRKLPAVLPCSGKITSYFGGRENPFWGKSSETHEGVDIANIQGTSIKAAGDGVVSFSGWKSGYGYVIIINHENGYESFYGHNSKLKVSEGTQVKRGDLIALMGSTGRSTGTHCHFEVRYNGAPMDPFKLINQF